MAISRADSKPNLKNNNIVYSDFTNNFIKNPITNQLICIKNEDAVKQAFKNLILTNIGERFFNPFFGSNVERTEFELFGPFVVEDLTRYINDAAKQFESRVSLANVTFSPQPDSNEMAINIVFYIINTTEPQNMSIFLQRLR